MHFHEITVLNIPLDGITVQWMIAPQDTNLNDMIEVSKWKRTQHLKQAC